ncbi:hypothetical protein [Serratia symbiotica]|uniref:hypothetical protein n=1 Tax=Serratia symbiotica TaxID=138074 RepID=UPI001CF0A932|nr:hypothetical protein [Serratia symbiotica]
MLKTDYRPKKLWPPMEDAKGKQELFAIDYFVKINTVGYQVDDPAGLIIYCQLNQAPQ